MLLPVVPLVVAAHLVDVLPPALVVHLVPVPGLNKEESRHSTYLQVAAPAPVLNKEESRRSTYLQVAALVPGLSKEDR